MVLPSSGSTAAGLGRRFGSSGLGVTRRILIILVCWLAASGRSPAIKGTDKPTGADGDWHQAVEIFEHLGRFGLPDLRGARLVTTRFGSPFGGGRGPGAGVPLFWLLPVEGDEASRVIVEEAEVRAVRLWGRLQMMEFGPGWPPRIRAQAGDTALPTFDGEMCGTAEVLKLVRACLTGGGREGGKADDLKPGEEETRVFLLAANLQRTGRDQASRQVLQLLRASGPRLNAFHGAALERLVRVRAAQLVESHLDDSNWSRLHEGIRDLLAATPDTVGERPRLEQLGALVATRIEGNFADHPRYARLNPEEQRLVERLASERLAWEYFNHSLWLAAEWGDPDNPTRRPRGVMGEVLLSGPSILRVIGACLGDARPVMLTRMAMGHQRERSGASMPELVTLDTVVRELLRVQVPPGDLPAEEDDAKRSQALGEWCARASKEDRLDLARRFLEGVDEDRASQVAEWLVLRDNSGRGLKLFREWFPRQTDEWLALRGFLLLYDAIGRHGAALKDLLEAVKPRMLALAQPTDTAQRAIGHAWDLRRELTVLESMVAAPTPLEGILDIIGNGGISFTRCRERLPRIFLHTPPERNLAVVLETLPRFRWTAEAHKVLSSLRSSGGGNGLQALLPPVPHDALRAAWTTALDDDRELYASLPQFSATLGHAAASACLAIHGAAGRPRVTEVPALGDLEERESERALALALLRGEVPVLGSADPSATDTVATSPPQTSVAFLLGRLTSLPSAGRQSVLRGLAARERAQLRRFFTAPADLWNHAEIPASVRTDLCAQARRVRVVGPTLADNPFRKLDGRELSDETLAEILRLTAASLGNKRNEVTTLRLADSLDAVTLVSRPIDLAAMAFEFVGAGVSTWISQWLEHGGLGPEKENLPGESRRVVVISLVSPRSPWPAYPVVLTERLLLASLTPPAVGVDATVTQQRVAADGVIQSDVGAGNQSAATVALWQNLRALLAVLPPAAAPAAEPANPWVAPALLPCEGIIIWSFDPVAMRAALASP